MRDEIVRRWMATKRWSLLLLAAVPIGCGGGDMEVLLDIQPGACWRDQLRVGSFSVFIAVVVDGNKDDLLPVDRQCIDQPQLVPLTPEGLRDAFAKRGFVAAGVHTEKPTQIVIHPHEQDRCEGLPPICLISEPIPPDGEQDRVDLLLVCPPVGQPTPLWMICTGVAQ